MKPSEHYEQLKLQKHFITDPAQVRVIEAFDRIYQQLCHHHEKPLPFLSGLKNLFRSTKKPIKGMYLWGGVGRGKTVMMDIFFESLPFTAKKRMHFHRFMMFVHDQLNQAQGRKNPLEHVAKQFMKDTQVLCLDEFYVSDIADAMLLGGLLKALFKRGLTLVTTSNRPPQSLYPNGLQREKFLPAIALIKIHTHVMHMDEGEDFRWRTLDKAEIYHYPSDPRAHAHLNKMFHALAVGSPMKQAPLTVNSHSLQTRWLAEAVVWFDFETLCMGPRSARDYVEIARLFHTVLISDVAQMHAGTEDVARRFVAMVDEFYERHVTLIIAGNVPMQDLYQGRLLKFEFQRTLSRLQEMQTHEYLTKPHLP